MKRTMFHFTTNFEKIPLSEQIFSIKFILQKKQDLFQSSLSGLRAKITSSPIISLSDEILCNLRIGCDFFRAICKAHVCASVAENFPIRFTNQARGTLRPHTRKREQHFSPRQ